MNKYDFNSKKYLILLVIVCSLFTIMTIKAFEYMPKRLSPSEIESMEESYNQNHAGAEVNNTDDNADAEADEDEEEEEEEEEVQHSKVDPRHKKGHIDFTRGYDIEPEFDEIKAPKGAVNEELPEQAVQTISSTPSNEDAIKYYLNAKKYCNDKNYSEALKELQKVTESTDDKEIKAMACELIAEIYVIHKRYGTALAFANKAYSLSPNNSREMLIARINYKSGNVDSAISEMNNMIKKDF